MKIGDKVRGSYLHSDPCCPFCGAPERMDGSIECGIQANRLTASLDEPDLYEITRPCKNSENVYTLTAPLVFFEATTGEEV